MGDCGHYDNQMAIILGEGVLQAYNYYQAWANNQSYQIKLGKYAIVDIISVFETFGASDVAKTRVPALKTHVPAAKAGADAPELFSEVPIGFTAFGSYSGNPPYSDLVILRGTQTSEEGFYDMDWSMKPCILNGRQYGQAATGVYNFYTKTGPFTNSLEQNMKIAVDRLAKRSYYPRWYFAGHSLGGALITLSALDAVANNWFDAQTLPATTMYTYGSLHVGDQDFATAFTKQVPDAYRVANLADWVPSLVGLEADVQGYVHVGLPVTFLWQKDGDWANHNMKDTYLRTLTDFSRVLQCGQRLYPQ
jgi:triacylglycerol lipase